MKLYTIILLLVVSLFICQTAGTSTLITADDISKFYMPVVSQAEMRKAMITDFYLNKVPTQYREFFANTCKEYNAPVEIAYSIIYHESRFDSQAVNHNSNGSKDVGMGQINSTYLMSYYVKKYWDKDEPFEMFNAEHNMYVAIKHIGFLHELFEGDTNNTIMAYNLGTIRVVRNRVPDHGYDYLNKARKMCIL